MNYLLPVSTMPEVVARNAKVAILPIGSFEQHGDHLPLATDTIIACTIANELAVNFPVFLLPPITISCSHEHSGWSGTVSISSRTLGAMVGDICTSLDSSGMHAVVLVNAHGGNYILSNLVQEGSFLGRHMALFPSREDWADARKAAQLSTTAHEDMHAGELETSILLYSHAELVKPGYRSADHIANDRRYLLSLGMAAYTDTGVIGRPSQGSAEKGRLLISSLVESFRPLLTMLEKR
ncbi:creatininase family protein [Acrocarpospora catenulata]|uniref:creatininase family protein n=1 Tax=Acrocarpospora catenulata TaxID=2836182 RepID=UPI0027DED03F|nr:creatininase family protein [Acrocarpospora catenulata]